MQAWVVMSLQLCFAPGGNFEQGILGISVQEKFILAPLDSKCTIESIILNVLSNIWITLFNNWIILSNSWIILSNIQTILFTSLDRRLLSLIVKHLDCFILHFGCFVRHLGRWQDLFEVFANTSSNKRKVFESFGETFLSSANKTLSHIKPFETRIRHPGGKVTQFVAQNCNIIGYSDINQSSLTRQIYVDQVSGSIPYKFNVTDFCSCCRRELVYYSEEANTLIKYTSTSTY